MGNSIEPSFYVFVDALPDISLIIWLLFLVVFLYTLIHAGVFAYHWYAYNLASKRFLKLTYIVYFAGTLFFLILLIASAIAITN